jgi:hypothetical protein
MANGGPLLSVFSDFLRGRIPTEDLLKAFVNDQLTAANVTVSGITGITVTGITVTVHFI